MEGVDLNISLTKIAKILTLINYYLLILFLSLSCSSKEAKALKNQVMKIICLLKKAAHTYTLFFEPVLVGHSFTEGDLRMYDDAVEEFSNNTPIFDTYEEAVKYAYIHTHGEANYLREFEP